MILPGVLHETFDRRAFRRNNGDDFICGDHVIKTNVQKCHDVPLHDILRLLADLVDDDLAFDDLFGDLDIADFRGDGVVFAVDFLHIEIELFADELIVTCKQRAELFEMRGEPHELFVDGGFYGVHGKTVFPR